MSRLYGILDKITSPGFNRYKGSDSISVASGTTTYTELGTITVPAGKGFVQGCISFPSNATGHRRVVIGTSGSTPSMARNSAVSAQAVNGANTILQVFMFYDNTEQKTYTLNATQNSGSSMTVTGSLAFAQTGW